MKIMPTCVAHAALNRTGWSSLVETATSRVALTGDYTDSASLSGISGKDSIMAMTDQLTLGVATAGTLSLARDGLTHNAIERIAQLVEKSPHFAENRLDGEGIPLGNITPDPPMLISHEDFKMALALTRLKNAMMALGSDQAAAWANYLRWMMDAEGGHEGDVVGPFDFEWGVIERTAMRR